MALRKSLDQGTEVLTFTGIIRYHLLFAIHLKTREVQIVGIHANPSEEWMKQRRAASLRLNIGSPSTLSMPLEAIKNTISAPAEYWHRTG